MMKYLYILLSLLVLTGCSINSVPDVVYVEAVCPHIEVLEPVPKVDGNITNGCVCGEQLRTLIDSAIKLRESETYYRTQITKYNKEFTVNNK